MEKGKRRNVRVMRNIAQLKNIKTFCMASLSLPTPVPPALEGCLAILAFLKCLAVVSRECSLGAYPRCFIALSIEKVLVMATRLTCKLRHYLWSDKSHIEPAYLKSSKQWGNAHSQIEVLHQQCDAIDQPVREGYARG